MALGIGAFHCVNDEGAFAIPKAFFIVGNDSLTEADTTLRVGDTLEVVAAPCVEEFQCRFQWKLLGPDSAFQAEDRRVRFVARRSGDYTFSLHLWEDNSGKKLSTGPIYFHIRVHGLFLIDAGADRSVREDDSLDLSLSASETHGDSWVVDLRNPPRGSHFEGSRFRWKPGFDQEGIYPLVFHGSSGAMQDSDSVLVTVTNTDRPPSLILPGSQSIDEGSRIHFRPTASDEDGDTVVITASDLPAGAVFDSGGLSWVPGFHESGRYRLRFTARSGELSVSDTVLVQVRDRDRKPELLPLSPKPAREGAPLSIAVSALDPDGDSVLVTATGLPKGADFADRILAWTPTYTDSGSHILTLVATARGLADTLRVTLRVLDSDRGPWVDAGPDLLAAENQALLRAVSASDPDGDSLAVTLLNPPKGAAFDGTVFRWTPGFDQAGPYGLAFRGRSRTLEVSDTLRITVANLDRPPVLIVPREQSADEGSTLSFNLTAEDPDGDTVRFTASDLPPGAALADSTFSWRPTFQDSGLHKVRFTASSGPLSVTDTVTLAVRNVDRKPRLEVEGTRSGREGQLLAFSVGSLDPDGDPVSVTAMGLPRGAVFQDPLFHWNPSFESSGSYIVSFMASALDKGDTQAVTLIIADSDRQPRVDAGADLRGAENQAMALTVASADPAGGSLVVDLQNPPPGSSFDGSAFRWTPGFDQAGTYTLVFRGRTDILVASDTLLIEVVNVDRPPILTVPGEQATDEGSPLAFQLSAIDPDGDPLTVTAAGMPQGAVFQYPRFSWTPDFTQAGSHLVTWVASARNLSDTQRVSIEVANYDRGPKVSAGADRLVAENQALELPVSGSDPDGDPVVLELRDPPPGAAFDGTTLRWTPGFDQAGSYALVFHGRSKGLEASDTLHVLITQLDRPPTLEAGQDLSAAEGTLLSRKFVSGDPDGDSVSLSLLNPPAGAVLVGDSLAWTPAFTQAGAYRLAFRARSNGLQVFDTLGITVSNFDRPPSLGVQGQVTMEEGRRTAFQVVASDPDGDACTVSVRELPPGATFDSLTFAWTPGYQDSGVHRVRFLARAGALADSQEVAVTVLNVNRKPVASAGPDTTLVLGDSTRLAGSGSDPDGDPLAYRWTPPAEAVLADPSSQAPWFRPGKAGQFLFALRASDHEDTSAPDFVLVTVLDTAPTSSNRAPVAEAGANSKALLGDIVVLNGSGSSDPDGDPLKFIWKHFSNNPDTTLRLDSSAGPSFRPTLPGRYGFILYVFDGEKYSAPDQIQVDISSPDWQVSRTRTGGIYVSSLAEALDSAASGDTIYVEPGEYLETRDLFVGSRHANVYLFGIDRATTVINLGCRVMDGRVFTLKNTSGVKVEGLTFKHGGRGDASETDSAVGGIVVHNSTRIQLVNVGSQENCGDGMRLIHSSLIHIEATRIRNNVTNGIRSTGSSFDLVRSSLRDNGTSPTEFGGIAIEGDSTQIGFEGDTLQGNLENQIKITNRSRLVLRNTRISGSGGGIVSTQGAHPDLDIADCVFSGNTGSALFCWDGGSVAVRNSLFDKAGLADLNKAVDFISCIGRLEANRFQGYGLAVTLSASSAEIVGNTFSGNATDAKVTGGNPPCPVFTSNLWPDPPPALDYSGTSCTKPGDP